MSSVDDRIVNMKFENTQFKQGAADSQKALEGLDKTIANTGKGGGLTNMGNSVDTVKTKFSALQVAGVAAVATIASKATSAAISMVKGMTLDPIMQGFQEYQTNLQSIQTVMSNTGESVKTVNSYMNQLNKYSDQTIYNFSEMAKNIGTFTAAGVDLKTATASIQGIANLAALSGSNSQQASTAMYQLSQAIAAGRVGLQDWNSVVNAGMGGKIFQTALAQTATAMGTVGKEAVDLGGKMGKLKINGEAFRQSISAKPGQESWLTGDVLTKTLTLLDGRLSIASYRAQGFTEEVAKQKVEFQQTKLAAENYTEAQIKSMTDVANKAYEAATVVKTFPQLIQVVKESIGSIWANSFQIIMGNFNQSKRLWSGVSKYITGNNGLITKMGNAWTGMLRGFVDAGGRNKVLVGFTRLGHNILRVIHAVKNAFKDVFPSQDGSGLAEVAEAFANFTRNFAIHKETMKSIRSIFGGIFAIFHIGFTVVKGLFAAFVGLFAAIGNGVDKGQGGILKFGAGIGDLIVAFDKWFTSGNNFVKIMSGIGTVIGTVLSPLYTGLGLLGKAFSALVSSGDQVTDAFGSVSINMSAINTPLYKIKAGFEALQSAITNLDPENLRESFERIGESLGLLATGGIEAGRDLVDGIIEGIKEYAPQAIDAIVDVATGIIEGFKASLGIHSPSTVMKELGLDILEGLAIGILTGVKWALDGIAVVGTVIKDAFSNLFSGGFDKTTALDIASFFNAIFSGALLVQLNKFVFGLGSFVGSGPQFIKVLEGIQGALKGYQNSLNAQAIKDIAISVAILAASVALLSLIPPDKIAIGIGAISTMMATLVGALSALSKVAKGEWSIPILAASMVLISTALLQLAAAILIFGTMDMSTMAQGLGGMGAALAILVTGVKSFAGVEKMAATIGPTMLIVATAMNVLAGAVFLLGSMSMETLAKGLGAMAIGMQIMVTSLSRLIAIPAKTLLASGAAMFILAEALVVMAGAVAIFGHMSLKTLAIGFGSLALALVLMVGSLKILSANAVETYAAAAAMALMATAMIGMAVAVGMFGNMDAGTLAKGFVAIAVGLGLLIAAAALAAFVAPGFLVLSGSLLAIGQAMALAGAGMFLFGTGFAIMAAAGTAGVAILVVAFQAFLALLPTIAIQLAASFVSFVETIAAMSPRLQAAFAQIFEGIIGVVMDAIPVIEKLVIALMVMGIHVLKSFIPEWVEMGFTIIDKFLESAANHIPDIVDHVADLVTGFIKAFGNYVNDIANAGVDLIVTFLDGMGSRFDKIVNAAGDFILDILNAIDSAVVKYTDDFRDAGLSIAYHLLDGLSGGLLSRGASVINAAMDKLPDLNPLNDRVAAKKPANGVTRDQQNAVSIANDLANAIQAAGESTVASAATKAARKDRAAERAAIKAQVAQQAADAAAKIANKKGASQKQKAAAKAAQKKADRLAAQANAKRSAADSAAQAVADAQQYAAADNVGKGDIQSDKAVGLADAANALLEKANAEFAAAKKLHGDEKKKMLEKARADAKRAKALAEAAAAADAEAKKKYGLAFADELAEYEAEVQAEKDAAIYDAADNVGKSEILKARSAKDQADSVKYRNAADKLYADAKKAQKEGDTAKALRLLEEAKEAAAKAKEYADKAKQEAADAVAVLSGGAGSQGAGPIQPSKSVLEDAARAVDRYTSSLMSAQEMAGATQTVVQYNQNVYSPAALDAATIYRNSKNLVSAQEVKMGVPPGTGNQGPIETDNEHWVPGKH